MSGTDGGSALGLDDPELERALYLGLERTQPRAPRALAALDERRWPLALLALKGAEVAFARPAPPPLEFDASMGARERAGLVPDPLRRALRALPEAAQQDGPIARAIASALARAQLRLHPFDLPALGWLVRARRTAERARDGEAAYDDGAWEEATHAARGALLADARAVDPDRARDLARLRLEGAPAATRARVVEALLVGLAEADLELLAAVREDGAKSVRERAEDLLARIPGTPEYEERVAEGAAQIELGRKGLKRRKTAALRGRHEGYGAGIAAARAWMKARPGVRLAHLARALELSAEELVAWSAGDAALQTILAWTIVEDTGGGHAPLLAGLDGADWVELLGEALSPVGLRSLAEAVDPTRLDVVQPLLLVRVLEAADGPLPRDRAMLWMKSRAVRALLEDRGYVAPYHLVPLTPAAERPRLRKVLDAVDGSPSAAHRILLDLLDGIDAEALQSARP